MPLFVIGMLAGGHGDVRYAHYALDLYPIMPITLLTNLPNYCEIWSYCQSHPFNKSSPIDNPLLYMRHYYIDCKRVNYPYDSFGTLVSCHTSIYYFKCANG